MATGAGAGAGAGSSGPPVALPPSSGAGSSAASEAALKLDDTVMSGLRVAAAFRDPRDQALRSVDLHATELLAVVVSEGDSIRLYDIDKRQRKKELLVKKRGATLLQFTHHPSAILYAATKPEYKGYIQYHSLHDNKLLRVFQGHTDAIVSLRQCPVEDWFMSTALDQTLRIWDMRQANCSALCKLGGRPGSVAMADIDPSGRAFGVIGSDGTVSMFDSRKLQTGPFSHAVIPGPALRPSWNDMRFSANGIYIALCNSAGDVMMKDTYRMDMDPLYFVSSQKDHGSHWTVSFSPDDKYLVSGNSIGSASVWNVDTRVEVKLLGSHRDKVLARFHPSRAVLCTAARDLACWLPSSGDDDTGDDVDMLSAGMSAYASSASRGSSSSRHVR